MDNAFKSALPTEKVRVITFDGGGIRGIFQTRFMLELADINLLEQSHLLAGTSTGAIIAVCLALNMNPDQIFQLYCSLGQEIFRKKKSLLSRSLLKQSAYSSDLLKKQLRKHLPRHKQFGNCNKRVLVAATSLNTYSSHVFDSYCPQHQSIDVVDVLLASTAAPTYFSPHLISGTENNGNADIESPPFGTTWADGGLTCNNPSFECVSTLLKSGFDSKNIHVLSIANGRQPNTPNPTQFKKMGLLGWAGKLVPICMEISSEQAHRRCKDFLPPSNYIRIDPMLSQEIELDNHAKSMEILAPLAKHVAAESRDQIKSWLLS